MMSGEAKQKNMRGATPGTWRRVATRDATDLQGYGIQADRIKIIYGGLVKKDENEDAQQALVQLWILPSDAPPPVKEARRHAKEGGADWLIQ